MSVEIEAKMQVADRADLERRLAEAGATRGMTLLEINTFFDTPSGALKTADQGLRLRVERQIGGDYAAAIITHKGPRAHAQLKMRSETEVEVADARGAAALLAALGYHPVMSFEKRRQMWSLADCKIAVDELPHLGHFVEIEGASEGVVYATRDKLGLQTWPLIRSSYISMLSTWCAEHHIHSDYVAMEKHDA